MMIEHKSAASLSWRGEQIRSHHHRSRLHEIAQQALLGVDVTKRRRTDYGDRRRLPSIGLLRARGRGRRAGRRPAAARERARGDRRAATSSRPSTGSRSQGAAATARVPKPRGDLVERPVDAELPEERDRRPIATAAGAAAIARSARSMRRRAAS